MSSNKNKYFFFFTFNKEHLTLNRIFIFLFYLVLLFFFTINCSSIGENKSSKFENLWKEPANPPPESALLPESNTVPAVKKK